jgi:hypothetical protein
MPSSPAAVLRIVIKRYWFAIVIHLLLDFTARPDPGKDAAFI